VEVVIVAGSIAVLKVAEMALFGAAPVPLAGTVEVTVGACALAATAVKKMAKVAGSRKQPLNFFKSPTLHLASAFRMPELETPGNSPL
jgi:hypothetical protein